MRRQYLGFSLYFGNDEHGPYCGIDSRPDLPRGFDVLSDSYDGVTLKRVNMVTLRYSLELIQKLNRSFNVGESNAFFADEFRGNAPAGLRSSSRRMKS